MEDKFKNYLLARKMHYENVRSEQELSSEHYCRYTAKLRTIIETMAAYDRIKTEEANDSNDS
jgi:hypothetical protein